MREDVKTKWLEALRSGKFKQGHERLKRKHSDGTFAYCCIGVLCEIVADEFGLEQTPDPGERGIIRFGRTDDKADQYNQFSTATLPKNIERAVFGPLEEDEIGTLYGMNDSGKSFKHIAGYIERNFNDAKA